MVTKQGGSVSSLRTALILADYILEFQTRSLFIQKFPSEKNGLRCAEFGQAASLTQAARVRLGCSLGYIEQERIMSEMERWAGLLIVLEFCRTIQYDFCQVCG